MSRFILLPALCLTFAAPFAHAASQEQEYQQVRQIALRDPKVRAAYEDADRRLQEKIVRIDPALANYAQHRSSAPLHETAHSAPAVAPATSHPRPVSAPASSKSHTVAKGETLTSIASHYGVSVTALKAANHNPDEKHLSVGQSLVIPHP